MLKTKPILWMANPANFKFDRSMLPPQNCILVIRKSEDHILKGKETLEREKGEEMSTPFFRTISSMTRRISLWHGTGRYAANSHNPLEIQESPEKIHVRQLPQSDHVKFLICVLGNSCFGKTDRPLWIYILIQLFEQGIPLCKFLTFCSSSIP